MSKRAITAQDDGEHAYQKRQKITHVAIKPAETIVSSQQLYQLLAFDQDLAKAKHGIQSFRTFLGSLHDESDNTKIQLQWLTEFLASQQPGGTSDTSIPYINGVMQTWSLASQSNDESLLSGIAGMLAALLREVSSSLHLNKYGTLLVQTLLSKTQLELFRRGLSADKAKGFLIGPHVSLLLEVSQFDGGVFARQIYRLKDFTFKHLARNLGLRHAGVEPETVEKPSVRTNAVRFVCMLVKYLPPDMRSELLKQRDTMKAFLRDINHDPPSLIIEVLEHIMTYVLKDESLVRDAKSQFFNAINLQRLASLYWNAESNGILTKSIPEFAHRLLLVVCTTQEQGVLNRQHGYYPRGFVCSADQSHDDGPDYCTNVDVLEADSTGKYSTNIPVRNTTLSEFAHTLRPWSSPKHSELLLAIFKVAPELVAEYFVSKKAFSFEPKLTATWIGYSALLFSTVGLEIPPFMGNAIHYSIAPPPLPVVMENILPSPLTQKVLIKCLNHPIALIKYFGIQILNASFDKFSRVSKMYLEHEHSPIWKQNARQLTAVFGHRCPPIKEIMTILTGLKDDALMLRNATSRLLGAYFQHIPQSAFESKYDISLTLTEVLETLSGSKQDGKDQSMAIIVAEHLFKVAYFSVGMRWFSKTGKMELSPFITMLRMTAQAPANFPMRAVQEILSNVAKESGIVLKNSPGDAIQIVISALHSFSTHEKVNPDTEALVYSYLENCAARCSVGLIRYMDILESLQAELAISEHKREAKSVSLLLLALTEQWPFFVKVNDEVGQIHLARFLHLYFSMSVAGGEHKKTIKALSKQCIAATSYTSVAKEFKLPSKTEDMMAPDAKSIPRSNSLILAPVPAGLPEIDIKGTLFADNPSWNVNDNDAVIRWIGKEIDEVVEDGHAAALIMLLSSPYIGIRKEALVNLNKLAIKVKQSAYDEREQIWLLLRETIETAGSHVDAEALPTIISAFAANAINVLKNPLHDLYAKLNHFLTQGPSWTVDKIPLMRSIVSETPAQDDAYYREIGWLLHCLQDGLQTPADIAVYHKRYVFEWLLSFINNAYIGKTDKECILKIIYRATRIDGGSTTLVTRFSILSWLDAQIALEKEAPALNLLKDRILASVDKERLRTWSQGSLLRTN